MSYTGETRLCINDSFLSIPLTLDSTNVKKHASLLHNQCTSRVITVVKCNTRNVHGIFGKNGVNIIKKIKHTCRNHIMFATIMILFTLKKYFLFCFSKKFDG
jgi:hypothetical protein